MGTEFLDMEVRFTVILALCDLYSLFSERGHDLYWTIPRTLLQSRHDCIQVVTSAVLCLSPPKAASVKLRDFRPLSGWLLYKMRIHSSF